MSCNLIIGDYHPPPSVAPPARVILNHREFNFNSSHKTIAWKLINSQNSNCTPPLTFHIQSSTCGALNWSRTIPSMQYSIPVLDLINNRNELSYFSIVAINVYEVECARTVTQFQISPSCKFCVFVCEFSPSIYTYIHQPSVNH